MRYVLLWYFPTVCWNLQIVSRRTLLHLRLHNPAEHACLSAVDPALYRHSYDHDLRKILSIALIFSGTRLRLEGITFGSFQ